MSDGDIVAGLHTALTEDNPEHVQSLIADALAEIRQRRTQVAELLPWALDAARRRSSDHPGIVTVVQFDGQMFALPCAAARELRERIDDGEFDMTSGTIATL